MIVDNSQRPTDKHRSPTPARDRRRSWKLAIGSWELSVAILLSCAALGGCGKKGPPLAPIVHVPAAVDKVSARRVANDVYLTITIPTQNIDASTPADVSRIDVYGATSLTPPPVSRIFEIASKVASVDVQPPPRPAEQGGPAAAGPTDLPAQGTTVTLRESLNAEALRPQTLTTVVTRATTPAAPPVAADAVPSTPAFPRRYYVTVAVSDRGRQGPPGRLVDVPLPPLPDPPGPLSLSATDEGITVAWEPSGGVVGFLLETPAPADIAPVDEPTSETGRSSTPADTLPAGPTMYNVYRDAAAVAETDARANWNAAPAQPLNAAPLTMLSFTDSTPFEFGQERCYIVRSVRGSAGNAVISAPSPRGCITPVDTYPPAAPTGLYALSAEGVINLAWEPNGEADLAGYLVLRGRAGDATLQPLTTAPLTETRYADRDVTAGVRYVYAVQAVDMQTPRNISDESARVEETAR